MDSLPAPGGVSYRLSGELQADFTEVPEAFHRVLRGFRKLLGGCKGSLESFRSVSGSSSRFQNFFRSSRDSQMGVGFQGDLRWLIKVFHGYFKLFQKRFQTLHTDYACRANDLCSWAPLEILKHIRWTHELIEHSFLMLYKHEFHSNPQVKHGSTPDLCSR